MKLVATGLWLTLLSLARLNIASAYVFPPQTGPYVTGVQDLEYTDLTYPSPFAYDNVGNGRRIMFRLWYPVCQRDVSCPADLTTLGTRRRYFEDAVSVAVSSGRTSH